MKKRLTALIAAAALLAVPSASAVPAATSATVAKAIVSVDGRRTEILSFQIDNNNYFMLRDVAEALNGTSKQFDVSWDQTESATILHGGQTYQADEQSAVPYLPDESAELVYARIQYNDTLGSPHRTETYDCNYGNFNFYRLRDLGRLMDFYIGWENGVVAIDTNRSYDYQEERVALNQKAAPLVEISKLNNYDSLKKKMTDSEFQQAYTEAAKISDLYRGLELRDQLQVLYAELRYMSENEVSYSMETPHYSDVYGFFVDKTASCAGATRATGLCLNQLGIPYEHVNEGEYEHQWCRINVDGTYWICDPYGMYVGPEPGERLHPYFYAG